MKYLNSYEEVMKTQVNIALATSVNNVSNVRIVNFSCNKKNKNTLYFATFRGNPKTEEFAVNNNVSFITIPVKGSEFVRVKDAQVIKSDLSIFDLESDFVKRDPGYEMIIKEAGENLQVYEICFETAIVTIDFMNIETISL